MPIQIYDLNAYDKNLNLRVPFGVKFSILFGIKNLFIIFLLFNPLPKLAMQGFDSARDVVDAWLLVADLIILPILIAWIKRDTNAKPIWRKIWRYGKSVLLISYFYHFAFLSWKIITVQSIDESTGWLWLLMILIDLIIIHYLLRAPIVHDLFDDFPEKLETVK